MAVQEYLTIWNLKHLSDKFEATSLASFLSISHNTAVMCYGENFASHHQKLCDTLRSVLYTKRLRDRDVTPVTPGREEGCLLDVTSSMKTMCVSHDEPSDKTDNNPTRWEIHTPPHAKRYPVTDRLGPLRMPHTSIKMRLGSNTKHRRRRNQCRGNNNVRRDLNPAFRRDREYTPHNDCTFTRSRVPVKERLGVITDRKSRDVRVTQRRLDF